ncbi:MAG: potassium channel family protein [Alcaligenaceae bacterium]
MLLLLAFVMNTLLVSGAILIHYEVLFLLDRKLPSIAHIPPRFRVLVGVGVIFVTHVVEIWLFALGYFLSLRVEGMGTVVGTTAGHGFFLDCVYLSFITFTTVGYGDFVAQGYVRYLTGVEALTGLILITWSASFLFIEMQKYWTDAKRHDR